MRKTRAAAAVAAALALTLAACGNPEGTPATTGTTAPTAEPAPTTAEPTTAAPTTEAPATAEPDTEDPDVPFSAEPQNDPAWPGGGGDLLPVDVRIAAHEGYDRVVFEMSGTDVPGYRVEYVDAATDAGKGNEIDVAGDATLKVVITGFRYPEPGETGWLEPGRVPAAGTARVTETVVAGIFEGQHEAFVGLDAQVPFRAFTLTDPARLVVDVQTAP